MHGYIPTLDGWRAIAVVMVICSHSLPGLFEKDSWEYFLAYQGRKGVDIFFAISGFLITTRLLEEHRLTGEISLKRFYIRRAFRILPPYGLYLAVLAGLASAGVVSVSRWEWIGCIGFFRNYLPQPDVRGWYTAHFWSLSVEEHYYLVWPCLLIFILRHRALYLVVLLILCITVWRKIDATYEIISPFGTDRTDVRIDALLWGALAALLYNIPEIKAWLVRRFTIYVWYGLMAAAAIILFDPPFGLSAQAILFPLMLIWTILNRGSRFSRFLETPAIRWVGRLSYSLYIWQQLCVSDFWFSVGVLAPDTDWPVRLGLAVVTTFFFASLSYYLVERPAVRYGHRLARSPSGGGRPTPEDRAVQQAGNGGTAPIPASKD